MAELKTKATKASAAKFLRTIQPEGKRADAFALINLFEAVTGEKAVMWGSSIIGFGMYHYKSERSDQEGDWPLAGFSPRKQNLTLYIKTDIEDDGELLKKLGKHKATGGCLYIKRLSDVDQKALKKLIKKSYSFSKKLHA